jgi:two-component system response regulator AtoC
MLMTPRVIAASRYDDARALPGSTISRELYYRLRGVLLRIPPLRDRSDDIPLLAHFLLNKYAATFGRSTVRLSARVEEQFQRHSWPGNVRELENAVKALLAVDDEDLVLESISRAMAISVEVAQHSAAIAAKTNGHDKYRKVKLENGDSSGSEQSFSLKDASRSASRVAEKQLISEVLQRTSWNRKRAARELNISYKALLYKLKQNGLNGPGSSEEEELGETSK